MVHFVIHNFKTFNPIAFYFFYTRKKTEVQIECRNSKVPIQWLYLLCLKILHCCVLPLFKNIKNLLHHPSAVVVVLVFEPPSIYKTLKCRLI